jgi:hypothetical protein
MSLTADQALARMREIDARLERMTPDDPARAALEQERDELRDEAQAAIDRSRHPEALRRELANLERRLAGFEGEKIKRSLMERRTWINDPSAYAGAINERLDALTRPDREAVERRIARLRELLAQSDEDPSTRSAS